MKTKRRILVRILAVSALAGLTLVSHNAAAAEPPAPVQRSVRKAVRLSFASKEGKSYQLYRSRDGSTWEKHGEPIRHRAIYVSPADAKLVNGELPVGTVLVKELREVVNGQPGAVTDALTIMVKRGGSFNPEGGRWEYFMTDAALTQTMMRGGLETICAGCHSLARESDFAFLATELGR